MRQTFVPIEGLTRTFKIVLMLLFGCVIKSIEVGVVGILNMLIVLWLLNFHSSYPWYGVSCFCFIFCSINRLRLLGQMLNYGLLIKVSNGHTL